MSERLINRLMKFAKTGDIVDKSSGLCANFDMFYEVSLYGKDWKHYADDEDFPIEGNYSEFVKSGKYKGKRGKRRRSLARFIANKLRHEIYISQWHI